MRGETFSIRGWVSFDADFNPLPSCEGRPRKPGIMHMQKHFNPLPSCEGRPSESIATCQTYIFQSTPLMRGETLFCAKQPKKYTDFNPLPSCEGRHHHYPYMYKAGLFQSTPLMRGETIAAIYSLPIAAISIHSPHARGDAPARRCLWVLRFQSTPLMRGETVIIGILRITAQISIHSPHARGDLRIPC